jgi:FlaA1/EpsC-like NDP-sugar epimerase
MRRRGITTALPIHRHSLPQLVIDGGLVALAYFLAYRLRFDRLSLPERYDDLFLETIVFVVGSSIGAFVAIGLYRHWMRYSTQREYIRIAQAVTIATVLIPIYVAASDRITGDQLPTVPIGVLVLHGLLMLLFLAGVRFGVRTLHERPRRGRAKKGARSVLIVGAGDGGRLLLREVMRNPELGYRPVGFIDDDPRKQNVRIDHGLDVLGTTAELPTVLEDVEPDEVLIAIPSAPGQLRAHVVQACRERNVPVRTMPTVFELLKKDGQLMGQIRDVQVEDILGRDPVHMQVELVGSYLTDQVVMVTGAGGSIGSELCRQIGRVNPRSLILVDHAEDNLFEIGRQLIEVRHVESAVTVLADCKDEDRMREIFEQYRPTHIFHAAAYKHVGLMARNPVEAIRNNAIGTQVMTRIAGEFGADAFVLVSTDKAVSPATVMGASKALAEMALEAADIRYPNTAFATVRFGNVLGSSGSVVPIFRRQIAAGGPVTITNPNMTRYFMTIPESVQLIIQAGSMTEGGEIFVLEMGDPVSILELAKDMIRLCGFVPEKEIAIEVIGTRPGEKLHEDLFNSYESPEPTAVPRIVRAQRAAMDLDYVERTFEEVTLLVAAGDAQAVADRVTELTNDRGVPQPLS